MTEGWIHVGCCKLPLLLPLPARCLPAPLLPGLLLLGAVRQLEAA